MYYILFSCAYKTASFLLGAAKQINISDIFFERSHLPQVFLRLTEPLWAVHAVLDAAAVDGVVVLVVQ